MDTIISAKTASVEHFPFLIRLGSSYYPAGHPALTEEYITWFYLSNPAGAATLIVAEEDGLWIGLIVLIPVILECSGKMLKGCFAVNVLTHPEHRTKNLFSKMIRCAKDELEKKGIWLLGHPNASAMPGWKRQKMDFRDPLYLYLAKFRLPFSSIHASRATHLNELSMIPATFWEKLSARPDVHIKYSPEFIAWRFLEAPHKNYTVSCVRKSEEFIGLRITRIYKWPVDLLVDFVSCSDSLGTILSTTTRPTLMMLSARGHLAGLLNRVCWKLPLKRAFPFFVTAWNAEDTFDMAGITLAASDF